MSPKPITESIEVYVNIPAPVVLDSEKEQLHLLTQKISFDNEKLRQELSLLEKDKMNLSLELSKERELRETLEKEKECTFKNLYDENVQLKRANETLKKNETEAKKALEKKENELSEEVE